MQTILMAARNPLFVLVLVTAVLTGLFVSDWLFPLGLLVYVAAVVLATRDQRTVHAARVASQRAARSAAMAELHSSTFRTLVEKIDRTQSQIARSVREADSALGRLLQRIDSQARGLVEQAHALARKGQVIETYLFQIDHRRIQERITEVDAQLARTSDNYTVEQLQDTRRALVERQSSAQALETYISRIIAQLQNIDANLDNVLIETVRLRTADSVSVDSASNQVAERLRDLNNDMDAFQQVLDTALAEAGDG
jgi:hypothetical protein